ncbi:MAG TPA: tetratricopeptide repeat protein, partial [Pyrinomonadaceae bacterium]|nr:tetratricopeptide repeat protein [Pyrinomonadaceae bacterium]
QDYTMAIKLDGRLAPAYANRGYALFLQGKTKESERDFARAIMMAPRLRTEIEANIKLMNSWK